MMLLRLLALIASATAYVVNEGTECRLFPESSTHNGHPVDDTPSILQAFELCGTNGSVVFPNETFYVNQVMNTTNLLNCDVSIYVVFQNLSAAWIFGGTNVTVKGYGQGKFFGNGQSWYDENRNNSNQPGRPMSFVIYNSTNVLVDGLTWLQSQFWSTFVSYSSNVTMSNIFVNSTSNDGNQTMNTDGSDTWNSHDIRYYNWTVQNGDDCIAIKGNSSNVHARNITCYQTNGFPIGSVGQDPGYPDYVKDILFEDVTLIDSNNGGWIKAWQGVPTTTDSNGDNGGGGGGWAKNVTFRNFRLHKVALPIYITECIYSSDPTVCDTSSFQISDVTWENFTGTSKYDVIASIHCGAKVPCPGLKFININIETLNASLGLPSKQPVYQCANIVNQNATGVNSTGIPCNAWAPGDFPETPTHNY
ncbi:CAZyme family GH28 [Paecilomyces variotii]|nr:CAZyme family GH28 [Paecilomyces variotii]